MAAALIHRCQHCGLETDVGGSLEVFEQNPHCGQCGLSASEGDLKMQEELATMMTQRLHLENNVNVNYHRQPELPPTPPRPEPNREPKPGPEQHPQMTYITQHYHHSAHQVTPTPPSEQNASYEALVRHGIDASALFPSQLNLFKQARPEQQLRLIQLWSIAPPSYGNQLLAKDLVSWPQTSMQQEEEAAKSRYIRTQAEAGNQSAEHRQNAEPYIIRGYEASSEAGNPRAQSDIIPRSREYNRALDPAYQSREWWLLESQPIEQQYGMAQQMRQFADQDEDMS